MISDAVMAPILGPDGQALAAHGCLEGVNQIVRFDYEKDGLLARLTL